MTAPFGARLDDVVVRYPAPARLRPSPDDAPALDGATCTVRAGSITGVLGRNGAGKTTLLSLLAAFRRPTGGTVLVGPDGSLEDPWENTWITSGVQLVRESGDVYPEEAVSETFEYLANVRPDWDGDLASRLLDQFEVDVRKKPAALSRGKRSAVGAVIGLASRAPLTIFDEVYLGMDAPTRYAFYDALLEDYAEHPRTVLVSSHHVEEVERLFEDVIVLDEGRVLLAEPADDLRARAVSLTGPSAAVERVADGRPVLHRQQLGPTLQVVVDGPLAPDERAAAQDAGLTLGPVPLQDLFVHLTRTPAGTTTEEVP
ncbi:ATP-binding cassette domain-containing protein [Antribacter gilvus]|uniref:ATP-binding cassette domain-containing protein n=1 Tax=Antribacter gilvus TaxID=2304675 RepID=UPI000F79202B|nr:ABC transporter ATP-binding protein [Antribacter gilvus]